MVLFKRTILAVVFALLSVFAIGCGDSGSDAEIVDRGDTVAYLLKIDGVDVGYISNEDEINSFSDILADEKRKEMEQLDSEIVKITVNSKIESVSALCHPDEIKSVEEIAEQYYGNGGKISFSVTVNESEVQYISFETVYKNSSSYYEGTKVTQTEGQNGERTLGYEVTYVDGEVAEKKLISDTVTKKAVDRVVLVGTKKSTASSGSYRWPLSSVYITSSYGGRYLNGSYDFHLGVDLRASSGTSVYAADGGKVIYAGYMGSYGYLIKIQHDNGDQTYYAHLSKINVSSGSRVYKGQIIAKSGATGNVTGAHLHFEIRKSGSTVNPVNYLPSMRSVTVSTASLESCFSQEGACLSRSVPQASSYSKREQEEYQQVHRL